MNLRHQRVAMEVLNPSPEGIEERVEEALLRHSMIGDELAAAADEVVWGNDVEGAAIEVAALRRVYPNQNSVKYLDAEDRVISFCCPLWRLYGEMELSTRWQRKAEEMIKIIDDGAERILAGYPLTVW